MALGYLSKQIMLVFPAGIVAALLLVPRARRHAGRVWPWLAILLSLAGLLPILYWNREHDWVTFAHTAHHFESGVHGGSKILRTLPEFLSSQLLVVSPLTFLLFAAVAVGSFLGWRRASSRVRLLLLLSAVPFLGFLLLSIRQKVQPNWPAACYPAGMALLAGWALAEFTAGRRIDRLRRLFRPGLFFGAILAALILLVPFAIPLAGLGGKRVDLTRRLTGWRRTGEAVGKVLHALPEGSILIADSRQLVSQLAFYVPGQPEVFLVPRHQRPVKNQYDIWPGPVQMTGSDALIVMRAGDAVPAHLAALFEKVEKLAAVDLSRGPDAERRRNPEDNRSFELYRGRRLARWP
jgi:4-amino-4-deoxy-L-arabinose transferase-like glycosyltransferase